MFYILNIIILIILLSFLIVFSKNTIVALLALIWSFILSGLCFFLLGADFLALILIIVYGSAISILSLFIIILLNLRISDTYNLNYYISPIIIIIIVLLIIQFGLNPINFFNFLNNLMLNKNNALIWLNYLNLLKYNFNLFNFGIILYNYYSLFIPFLGIILLIALLGSIFLVKDNPYTNVGPPSHISKPKSYIPKINNNKT